MKKQNPLSLIIFFSFFVAISLLLIFSLKAVKINLGQFGNKQKQEKEVNTVALTPKQPEEKEIIITQNEIESYLSKTNQEYGYDLSVAIEKEGITTKGTVKILFVKNDLSIKVFPELVDGKLTFKILKAKLGIFDAPNFIVEKIDPEIQKYLDENVNNKGQITNVFLERGKITIRGKEI